jgi:thioredoxin reductase
MDASLLLEGFNVTNAKNRRLIDAVGDVRGRNIKRVASDVGEGSIAVAFVHQVLHE